MSLLDGHRAQDTADLPLILFHRSPTNSTSSLLPRLRTRYRVIDPLEFPDSNLEVSSLCGSVRVLVCFAFPPVTSETLDRYPSLEYILGTSAGLDHVDLVECRRRGTRVTSSGEAFSDDVADYAVGLLIDVLRRVSAADSFVRAGSWPVRGEFPLGSKVGGKRVGIVGLGNIGFRISKRLEAFGCTIAYTSREMKPSVSLPYFGNVLELARWSEVLVLCCSSTNETYHIVDKDVMIALGKKGIIINVGRGTLIDEKELVKFLLQGEIGGAGLDVFEHEPSVPKEFFRLDNVILSPHSAFATPESILAVEELVMNNIEAFFLNKPLWGEVNFNDN